MYIKEHANEFTCINIQQFERMRKMLCQSCHKRPANVHFTQIINNKKIEMYLCEQCANEKGQISFTSPFDKSSLLSGFIGVAEPYVSAISRDVACKRCGMSFRDFQQTGKLGCSGCYEAYGDRLRPVLKRLHGNTEHIGKVPAGVSRSLKNTKEIERLKELLNRAVQREEYEKAAEIRDKIKAIESGYNS
jgi:protein arginine kinase activator